MTAKAALIKALLDGRILNVLNCTKEVGLTNIAREIPRCVEKPFGVRISRVHRTGKSRYKVDVWWTDYRLNRDADYNKDGIKRMREYLKGQGCDSERPKPGTKVREHTRNISKPQQPEYTNKLF